MVDFIIATGKKNNLNFYNAYTCCMQRRHNLTDVASVSLLAQKAKSPDDLLTTLTAVCDVPSDDQSKKFAYELYGRVPHASATKSGNKEAAAKAQRKKEEKEAAKLRRSNESYKMVLMDDDAETSTSTKEDKEERRLRKLEKKLRKRRRDDAWGSDDETTVTTTLEERSKQQGMSNRKSYTTLILPLTLLFSWFCV